MANRTAKVPLVILVLLALGFGSSAPGEEKGELKLAFITCARDGQFFLSVKKGMNDAAVMCGVRCDWLGTEGVDIPAQAEMLRQAVKEGYDGVAFNIITIDQ